MKTYHTLLPLVRGLIAGALVLLAGPAFASDRVELTDGSVIIGKLTGTEGEKFKVETGFAGTIEIARDQVRSFSTDEPVNVALASGSQVLGQVAIVGDGIVVVTADGQMSAPTGKVVAVWREGEDSPEVRRNKRHWRYEASLAINGRTGESEIFAGALAFKGTLESAQDKLIFNLAAEQARNNGVETADRQMASVDYSSFVSAKGLWYARTMIEKDAIKELDLRSTTAFGLGRKLIKNERRDLELRLGVSYLYEIYANGATFDSPGLDVTLIHSRQFLHGQLGSVFTYTPAFKNFANFRLHHETTYEVPLSASLWKLKLGLSNDYISIPHAALEKLDTLYFTSLILNWQ